MFILARVLAAALPGLKAGGTVTLGPGPYDLIEIKGRHFDPPVKINAGDTLVKGLRIWDSSGIIWRGGTIQAPGGAMAMAPMCTVPMCAASIL